MSHKLFFQHLGKEIALHAKKLEEESVWLDRVKKRRKWRDDFWQTLLDFLGFIVSAPIVFCVRILFPFIKLITSFLVMWVFVIFMYLCCFQFVYAGCYEVNYGTTPSRGFITTGEMSMYAVYQSMMSNLFLRASICNHHWIRHCMEYYRMQDLYYEQRERERKLGQQYPDSWRTCLGNPGPPGLEGKSH